jgi:hypothetical protein
MYITITSIRTAAEKLYGPRYELTTKTTGQPRSAKTLYSLNGTDYFTGKVLHAKLTAAAEKLGR